MKKVIYSLVAGAMMLASCSDFTDITQKGKNLLASTDDLELLLNETKEIWGNDMRACTGVIYAYSSVSSQVAQPNKSRMAILYSFDESQLERFEQLTTSDSYYSNIYGYIGKVANPILTQLDAASGTDAEKKALKAEALTLRAFSHYLLVQKYAKAYSSSAASDPAIVLLTEDVDIQTPQPKATVQEVYDQCLKDINEAIALNAMPETAASIYRMNKASMYAVKAHICLGMQDYTGAIEAANQALALNNKLYDYWANASETYSYGGTPYFVSGIGCDENPETYFAMVNSVYYTWVNPEISNRFEDGYATFSLEDSMMKMYKGISAVMPAYAVYEQYNAILGLPGWSDGYDFDHYSNDSGLCTPMMYLVQAEAYLQSGNIGAAMGALDMLRAKRIQENNYHGYQGVITTKAAAIEAFKATYLAENIWTQTWNYFGFKRWNAYGADWQETLSQNIGGQTYSIAPTSQFWVFPFPTNVSSKNPNLTWNKAQ